VIPDRTIRTASPGNTGETGAIEIHLAGARLTLEVKVQRDPIEEFSAITAIDPDAADFLARPRQRL
jgi:hypothetical protein